METKQEDSFYHYMFQYVTETFSNTQRKCVFYKSQILLLQKASL